MAILISADDIKKELSGYSPERASEYHSESAKLADKRFEEALRLNSQKRIILMAGGPASGKTEYVSEYLMDLDALVLDGILPTEEGAGIKIKRVLKSGKIPEVHLVLPKALALAYTAFLHRDRKFDEKHFLEKHSSARRTVLWVAREYPAVPLVIIESAYAGDDMEFTELKFESHESVVAFLAANQYTPDEIAAIIST